jgi:bifunctional UDP-N-acetylglucosamine pyrophosphorylase/glucosamine-1-phosphate N-acetyltransferase
MVKGKSTQTPRKKATSKTRGKSRFAIAIMAAGKGTRLKSRHPKVLHQIGGKALLEHVIAAAAQVVSGDDIYCIVGHEAERVRQATAHTGVKYVLQPEQRGTGDAVNRARDVLSGYEHVLVLSGDVPLIRPETIERVRDFHIAHGADMTILTTTPPDPSGYGRVLRKSGKGSTDEVEGIVEQKAATPGQLRVREINSGIYAFRTAPLFEHIRRIKTDNPAREYYLTDMAGILGRAGKKVMALSTDRPTEVLGANRRSELAELDAAMRQHKCEELMDAGVTIYRPETCIVDAEVQVAADTILEPFVQLLGRTKIGSDCRVRSYSVIRDAEIGDNVEVRVGCVIQESKVENGALLGPYCHLRPGSEIGEGAHVGNFVETKKVRLGRGAKANHLTYLGDAEIGERTNIGAGTITCNYDGVHKHQTTIGKNAFVGSDATLVAPVTIGDGAYVGAGSCITENVPADALALGRSRQVTKPGWVKKKKTGVSG